MEITTTSFCLDSSLREAAKHIFRDSLFRSFFSNSEAFLSAAFASKSMTRGNQRDRDRERAQARSGKTKTKDDGLTPEQRRERDAKALQEKAAKKAEKGQSAGDSAGGKSSNKK